MRAGRGFPSVPIVVRPVQAVAWTFQSPATFSGSGSLSVTRIPTVPGTAALSGTGTLSAVPNLVGLFTGTGSLTILAIAALDGTAVAKRTVVTVGVQTGLSGVSSNTISDAGTAVIKANPGTVVGI